MGPEGLVSEHVLQVEVLAVVVELGMQPTQIRPKRGARADNITLARCQGKGHFDKAGEK